MPPRKVGQIPATADVAAQEAFKTEPREPRVAAAPAGQRVVFFLDAAPGVFAPVVGLVGGFERLWVKAPSGRQRLNVLAALNATTRDIFSVTPRTASTSETVCAFLRLWAGAHPQVPRTIVRDTARSRRCALGQGLAQSLGIALLGLPAYSPTLHLLERFWKLVNKTCLSSQYDADHLSFQQAMIECMAQARHRHKEEWASVLTLQFQSCKEVLVIGEASNVCLFPVARQTKRKVSSKAA